MFAIAWVVSVAWIVVAVAAAAIVSLTIVAAITRRDRYVIPAVGLVATGLVLVAVGAATPVGPGGTVTQLLVIALGIVGGSPVVRAVLALAEQRTPATRDPSGDAGDAEADPAVVLRGGSTIGYLERAAVVAAVLLARWEILAVLVAIKSVGRFRDLDAGHHVTERFIIGTLASLLWAGSCAALIALV